MNSIVIFSCQTKLGMNRSKKFVRMPFSLITLILRQHPRLYLDCSIARNRRIRRKRKRRTPILRHWARPSQISNLMIYRFVVSCFIGWLERAQYLFQSLDRADTEKGSAAHRGHSRNDGTQQCVLRDPLGSVCVQLHSPTGRYQQILACCLVIANVLPVLSIRHRRC